MTRRWKKPLQVLVKIPATWRKEPLPLFSTQHRLSAFKNCVHDKLGRKQSTGDPHNLASIYLWERGWHCFGVGGLACCYYSIHRALSTWTFSVRSKFNLSWVQPHLTKFLRNKVYMFLESTYLPRLRQSPKQPYPYSPQLGTSPVRAGIRTRYRTFLKLLGWCLIYGSWTWEGTEWKLFQRVFAASARWKSYVSRTTSW